MYMYAEEEVLRAIRPDEGVAFVNLSREPLLIATLGYQHDRGQIIGQVISGCQGIGPGQCIHVSKYKRYAIGRASAPATFSPVNWNVPISDAFPVRPSMDNETIQLGSESAFRQSGLQNGGTLANFYKFGQGLYAVNAATGVAGNAFHLQRTEDKVTFYSRARKYYPNKDAAIWGFLSTGWQDTSRNYPKKPPSQSNLVHYQFKVTKVRSTPYYRFAQVPGTNQVQADGITQGFRRGGLNHLFEGRRKCSADVTLFCDYAVLNTGEAMHNVVDQGASSSGHTVPRPVPSPTPRPSAQPVPVGTLFRLRNNSTQKFTFTLECVSDTGQPVRVDGKEIRPGDSAEWFVRDVRVAVRSGQPGPAHLLVGIKAARASRVQKSWGYGPGNRIDGLSQFHLDRQPYNGGSALVATFEVGN